METDSIEPANPDEVKKRQPVLRRKSLFPDRLTIIFLVLCIVGGSIKIGAFSMETPGIGGAVKTVDEFQDSEQRREMNRMLFTKVMDSMDIKNLEAVLRILEQIANEKYKPRK